MGLGFDASLDRPEPLRELLRPVAIWLGIASFFAGTIATGATLAAGGTGTLTGPLLLFLGVSLIGGGFLMEPTEFLLDPELEFSGREWYFVAAVSVLFVLLTAGAIVAALV